MPTRHFRLPLAALAVSLSAAALAALAAPHEGGTGDAARWDGRRHVVHEWGTFTVVQGSDGVVVGGLVHDPFGLPPFVYELRDRLALTGLATKMETPIVYFYAPAEWGVRVDVGFPRGLVTQWYPGASRANGRGGHASALADLGVTPAGEERPSGYVRWGSAGELTVLAPGAQAPLPEVADDDPWRHSRAVAANALRVRNESTRFDDEGRFDPEAEGRDEHERFLFYRGLGDFELPLAVGVAAAGVREGTWSGELVFENRTPAEPLTHLILLYVEDGRASFLELPDLGAAPASLAPTLTLAQAEATADALVDVVAARLVATGLYTDEAFAMARTWRDSWFLEEGLRVLYVMPPALVERELPLRVRPSRRGEWREGEWVERPADPEPDEIVRTFVGRLDVLTPDKETRLLALVAALLGPESQRERAGAALRAFGRYAEPFLRRAEALGAAPAAVAAARALLSELDRG